MTLVIGFQLLTNITMNSIAGILDVPLGVLCVTYLTSYFISLISCTKVQLIHFVTHFHHIHLTDHSLSDSHSPFGFSHTALYFNVSLCLSFFQPIPKALYGHDQKTQTLFWTLKKKQKNPILSWHVQFKIFFN